MSFDRTFGDEKSFGQSAIRHPLGDQPKHFPFALGELGERIFLTAASQEPRDDGRIDHGFAVHDATQRIDNVRYVEYTLFEEIPHSRGMLLHKSHRVAGFNVLRENEHPNLRVLGSDRLRGDETFVRIRWRHPDIYDCDVRLIPADVAKQAVGVFCLAHHVDAGVLEKVDNSFSGKQDVVCNDYAHGISACRLRGAT